MDEKNGGYGKVYREIMRSKKLTPESKAIYAYLCSFAGSGASCYPGAELMRKELCMSPERFYKHMHYLTKFGIIQKKQERNGNRLGRVTYSINHKPDFQILENRSTEIQSSEILSTDNVTTDGHIAEKPSYNNNSPKKNSLNNNSIEKDMVNLVDRICKLLNIAYENAHSKGRLKTTDTGIWCIQSILDSGITVDEIVRQAESISKSTETITWWQFQELFTTNKRTSR